MSVARSLPLAIRGYAAARPRALAVRDAAGDLTFVELDRAADEIAETLGERGVARGDRVALLAVPSRESIALLAGIARAGAVAVPLGTRLTRHEIAGALGEATPTLLFHDADLAPVAIGHGVPAIDIAALLAGGPAVAPGARAAADLPRGDADPDTEPDADLDANAVAVFTSGTAGRPRAALLSHRALAASAAAWTAALPPATGWLLCLGLAHVAGLGVAWRALGAGLPLHVVAGFEPDVVLALLRGQGAPSHVSLVPVQLVRLLEAAAVAPGDAPQVADASAPAPGDASPDAPAPAALRAVLLGGAPIPPDLVRRATAAGWPVIATYGLTEAGSGVTALPTVEAVACPDSSGYPLPGVTVRIAEPGPDGVGEIEVRTPAAFSGYLGQPEATRAAFTADGWLRTGDLGRLDADVRIVVADRRDDLVISGGENVYPAEVEAALVSHPAIEDAGVAGRADPAWGAVPVAGIALRRGFADPGDAALDAWCRERLAPSKVPASFIRLAALPRTGSGKLRRRELRETLTPLVVLLHATLSTGRQLAPLARALDAPGDLRLVAPDRLGSGTRRLDPPREVGVAEHVADLGALLDSEGVERAIIVGHSFGGVVALEAAARLPDRVAAVVVYEPPYAPLADPAVQPYFALVARETRDALERDGRAGAARAFLERVAGPGTWDAMPERARAFLAAEGGGAVADAAMAGLDPDGLARIGCPVTILTGAASEPFYTPIADRLATRITGARRVELAGLRHTAPITDAPRIAQAVRAALARPAAAEPFEETSP
jgi:O-succinylbenzoic acid--CoA ligase